MTVALIAYAGLGALEGFDDDAGVLGAVGEDVLGSDLGKFLVAGGDHLRDLIGADDDPAGVAHLAFDGGGRRFPEALREHPSALPDAGVRHDRGRRARNRLVRAGASSISENFLFDSLSALSLMIAFYYGLTGLACVIYWRREITKSAKNFLFIGVAPLLGALGLFYLLYESVGELADPKASYSGSEVLGLGVPLVIAIVFIGLGLILMVLWRLLGPPAGHEFFARRGFEAVPPEVASGEVAQVEAIGVSEAAADAGQVADNEEER